MTTLPRDLSDQDVERESALPGKKRRLNCGAGLSVLITDNGQKYFQLRAVIDGESKALSLGKFPEVSLMEARKKAATLQDEIQRKRGRIAEARNKEKIRGDRRRKEGGTLPCFAGIEDARSFLTSLRQHEFKEATAALQLQLLLPAKSSALLSANWSDFSMTMSCWCPRKGRLIDGQNGQATVNVYFPNITKNILLELHQATGGGKLLFPTLSALEKKGSAEKQIIKVADEIWNKYPINPNHFPTFFKRMALEHSYFREELINEVASHTFSSLEQNVILPYPQRMAIYQWWADALTLDGPSRKF